MVASELASSRSGGTAAERPAHKTILHLGRFVVGLSAAIGGLAWTTLAQAQGELRKPAIQRLLRYGHVRRFGIRGRCGWGGVAVGYGAHSAGLNSVTLGYQAYAAAINSLYLGAQTAPGTGALGESSIAIGTDVTSVTAAAPGSVAIGIPPQSKADLGTAIAIGLKAQGNGPGALPASAMGTQGNGVHSTAVGWQAYTNALNAVYLGSRTVGEQAQRPSLPSRSAPT